MCFCLFPISHHHTQPDRASGSLPATVLFFEHAIDSKRHYVSKSLQFRELAGKEGKNRISTFLVEEKWRKATWRLCIVPPVSQPTLVGHRLAPRCSEAVQFSTLTTKLFFLSLLHCSPPSSCSQARKRVHPYPQGLGPTSTVSFHYYTLPPLQTSFLCILWVLSTNSRREMETVHCIYWLFVSPCTHLCLPLTRLLSAFSSDPVLLSLGWRKDDPESLISESCHHSSES